MSSVRLIALCLLCPALMCPQAQKSEPQPAGGDPLQGLDFLIGTWSAQTDGGGSAGAAASGMYTFRRDLGGHVLERTGSTDACKAAADFNCHHHDQLTIFADPNSPHGNGLYALYLDTEGHVIHYVVTTPAPHTAVFLSQGPASEPHFRLTYHFEVSGTNALMTGSFEGAGPGSDDFHPYLQWSGTRK